jgi:hypothetical protein
VEIRFTTDGTAPDSLRSPIFKKGITLSGNTQVRAKAFKPGWYSSDITEYSFYAARYRPASLTHLAPPDEQYRDAGNKTLIDLQRGDNNFRSGRWIAFRKNKMEALLSFNEPSTVSGITVSTLVDIGAYIMPPAAIEVWGGNDPMKLKLLSRQVPEQPTMIKPAFQKGIEIKFSTETVRYLKLIALPVSRLPAWHPGKGDKGWIFMDEVIVN